MTMITALDLLGSFVFAVSGAFRAVKHELDLLGVLVLAVSTGVGGGILRDVLLGEAPPAVFANEAYLLVCLVGGAAVFVASRPIAQRWNMVLMADAVGLGVFAALGAERAAAHGLGPVGTVFMAVVTATGGGVVRDLLVVEIPVILRTGFYATAALIGGTVYVVLNTLGAGTQTALLGAMVLTTLTRFAAMWTGIGLPRARRLPASPSDLISAERRRRDEGNTRATTGV
jgi:uncharacterized membrane protein YeiH